MNKYEDGFDAGYAQRGKEDKRNFLKLIDEEIKINNLALRESEKENDVSMQEHILNKINTLEDLRQKVMNVSDVHDCRETKRVSQQVVEKL